MDQIKLYKFENVCRCICIFLLFVFVDGDRPKPIMRRGVLMSLLQQNALTLPLWISKPGEKYAS